MKEVLFDSEARVRILKGMKISSRSIKGTTGPKGRNVIIERPFQAPGVTNDGLTIAREIVLEDKFENIGASFIKGVAERTDNAASGGRSTAVTIAEELAVQGFKYIESGVNPVSFNNGMEIARDEVLKQLKRNSKKVTTQKEIEEVATISSESKEIGKMVAKVIKLVGEDGVVTVESSNQDDITYDIVQGMDFDNGFISPLFMNTNKEEVVLENCLVLITDRTISGQQEMVSILEKVFNSGEKNLLIIADDVKDIALGVAIENKMRGALNIVCVKAPEWGDYKKKVLKDLCVLTNANFISQESQHKLENVTIENLGRVGKVVVTKKKTTLINGEGEVAEYVKFLKSELEQEKDQVEQFRIKRRIAKLSAGVAVINVGASTEEESNYKKQKTEDGVSDAQSALKHGIVAGGGVALAKIKLNTQIKDNDTRLGYEAVKKAIQKPLRQIVINTGQDDDSVVLDAVVKGKGSFGYNAETNEYVEDMFEAGIIDSFHSTQSLIKNSISMVGMFLSSHCTIVTKELKEAKL